MQTYLQSITYQSTRHLSANLGNPFHTHGQLSLPPSMEWWNEYQPIAV